MSAHDNHGTRSGKGNNVRIPAMRNVSEANAEKHSVFLNHCATCLNQLATLKVPETDALKKHSEHYYC
jgi:hypothetical protein